MTRAALTAGIRIGKLLTDQIGHARRRFGGVPTPKLARAVLASMEHAPTTVALIQGIATGAGVGFDDVFALWYEELLDGQPGDRGCTDLVVMNEATADNSVLMGHTNDEAPGDGAQLVRIKLPSRPDVTLMFTGGRPSAAVNSAGLVFSGNQVDATDVKPGIPRVVLFMEACWQESIPDAVQVLLNPERASSFNHVLADSEGAVAFVEASATDVAMLRPSDGIFVHTNNFIGLPERQARSGEDLDASVSRLERATQELRKQHGLLPKDDLIALMSTHDEGGLCRHDDTETVFSMVVAPKERTLWYGQGHPCEGRFSAISY